MDAAVPAATARREAEPAVSAPGSEGRSYPPASAVPTQQGPRGVRFDFNLGARVLLPDLPEGSWRVRLRDLDTGNTLFASENRGAFVNSAKRWFVRFLVEVEAVDAHGVAEPVLRHAYDAAGRDVLVQFPIGTLGDPIAWFPYAVKFAARHGCRLTCAMSALIIPLFRDAYPDIAFVPHEAVEPERFYATYSIGLFFDDADCVWQPCDFRLVGLHRTAGHILGVDPGEVRPLLALPDESRPIAEPYVCIAVQSSSQAKYWNNPHGWREVAAFLRDAGYRVLCIDQKAVHGHGLVWTHIPHGAEDLTGDLPLVERARLLRHASAFVGLSSGLAWLAWAAGCPVVLISGFTHPSNEFATPYRVINYHACNSCWNDVRHRFDHADFLWCPRQAGTPRQFECTRLITGAHVISMIQQVPGLAKADPSLPTGAASLDSGGHDAAQES